MNRGFRLSAASGLHKAGRLHQQDQVLMVGHPHVPGCVLGVIADGMGGRSGGRAAADQVLLTARQLFTRYAPDDEAPAALLRRLVEDAHAMIRLTAVAAEQEPHSTVAAFLMNPDGTCVWAHAGDSRLYHFHRGRLKRRTRDHSYVQQLVDRGELHPSEAEMHPKSNLLVGCLGMESAPPIDIGELGALRPHDAILACSDGLWHHFEAEELGSLIAEKPPRDVVEILIEEALRRGRGHGDNISLAILKLEPLPEPAP